MSFVKSRLRVPMRSWSGFFLAEASLNLKERGTSFESASYLAVDAEKVKRKGKGKEEEERERTN